MAQVIEGSLIGTGKRVAIVIARFNRFVGDALLQGAQSALVRHGVSDADITVVWVPGSFEVPGVAHQIAKRREHHAIVALGVLIKGETPHFDFIASQVASGLAAINRETDVPVSFGVLTTDTLEQAINRAGAKAGNKGEEAALAALELANLYERLSG